MRLIRVCPVCLQGTASIGLEFCAHDGNRLSEPFPIPLREDRLEGSAQIDTVVEPLENYVQVQPSAASDSEQVPRLRADSKPFISKYWPDLLRLKRRTSRSWEDAKSPCWWFGFMEDDLARNEHLVFAGALDTTNQDFRLFKVPTSYLRQNVDKVAKTSDGWINIYIHMQEYVDVRNKARLSFRQFLVN